MEKRLKEEYKRIFSRKNHEPQWAVHKIAEGKEHELVHCPHPFVGKGYDFEKVKILLYASAENLRKYSGYLDDDEYAISRHRNFFERSVEKGDSYFPNVHIQPISDGALAIAALYVYMQFQPVEKITPAEFLEKIAFANYCKYTIQPENRDGRLQNQDYANNRDYLEQSHDYLEAEIALLKPDYIIMPRSIYWTEREFIDKIKGNAKIIPIYQMNARNINLRIKKYTKTPLSELDPVLLEWYEHLGANGIKGKTKENFLSVFNYLDDVIKQSLEEGK